MKPKCLTLPQKPDHVYIGICDDCEINNAEYERGNGIYYHEICGHCRFLDVMSRKDSEKLNGIY